MAILRGNLAFNLLRRISPAGSSMGEGTSPANDEDKLSLFFGPELWDDLNGRTVIDFGCGFGNEAIAIAKRGALHVEGVDIRENVLAAARQRADAAGVSQNCSFSTKPTEQVERILSVDAFEHFENAADILQDMASLLKPGGAVWISWGPPWLHPLGGHTFSVFPWAHLIFSEDSLLRWRATFRDDGARRFSEVAGGLNQMTLRKFCRLVEQSPFQFDWLRLQPIRRVRWIANRLVREFFTSTVQSRLVLKAKS